MSGAGIMLMSADVPLGSLCTTNPVSARSRTCSSRWARAPAWMPIAKAARYSNRIWPSPETPRWLAFSPPALAAGVRAVFGFPLQVGAVRLGAINLYRDRPGSLSDEQHADSLVLADIAAHEVLAMQGQTLSGGVASRWTWGPTSTSSSTRPREWWPPNSTSLSVRPLSVSAPSPSPMSVR